jgi:hypothetical protein
MQILRILLSYLLFTLIETTSGSEDCTESKKICQVKTAITAGVASVLDKIPYNDYDFGNKNIALLGPLHLLQKASVASFEADTIITNLLALAKILSICKNLYF